MTGPSIFNVIAQENIDCQLILEYAPAIDLQLLADGKALILNELANRAKVG
ncbi:Xylose isomerase OS=Lysinibacillus sphaericus OX=1421 GN=LS41612_14055 PE=4 SV=1 [Lysinibacillus sphaericus]